MSGAVELPRIIIDEIVRHARSSPEVEVCGLVSTRDGRYVRCYPVANTAHDARRRFEMDPQGQIDAFRAMRERGEELAAIYHSHPDTPPAPSATDIAEHEYPDTLYLIVSLASAAAPELRACYLRGKKVETVEIKIVGERGPEAAGDR